MAGERLITVSELRCACIDPQWRQRWLRGEKPSTQSFGAPGAMAVQGAAFHQIAYEFVEWLSGLAPGSPELERLRSAQELWVHLHDHFARARLEELIGRAELPSAHHLARALRSFCGRLDEQRQNAGDTFRSWADLFLTQEFRIEKVPFCGGLIRISGRPDAVRTSRENGVEVIDYKLSRGSNLKHDLVQLAVYARLLREVKPGLRFAGILEYYEPELHVVSATAEELDALFREIVEPVLEELSGGRRSPAQPSVQRTDLKDFDAVSRRIQECFGSFKLAVTILRAEEAPQLFRYRVLPAAGVKVVSLANRAEDLQVALNLKEPPLIRAAAGCVLVDLPKENPDAIPWSEVAARYEERRGPLAVPLGVGVEGKILGVDLGDPNTCHALVAGASGSGKSELLKSFVASLISRNPPDMVRLTLIDPKSVTFAALRDSPHLLGPILTEIESTLRCLEEAVHEMDQRYSMLSKAGVENLAQLGPSREHPFRVLVFDEFADLVLQGRGERVAFEQLVSRLAQKGRAAGIHLVLATQRPDARVVTGLIKSNLPLRICLRVSGAVNSQIVLDEPGAETLLGRGDFLCERGRGIERAQSPIISREDLARLVGPAGS